MRMRGTSVSAVPSAPGAPWGQRRSISLGGVPFSVAGSVYGVGAGAAEGVLAWSLCRCHNGQEQGACGRSREGVSNLHARQFICVRSIVSRQRILAHGCAYAAATRAQ